MRGPRPFRIFLMVILVLTPLAQYFWFVRAWRLIDAMAWPGLRYLGQSLWLVAVLIVLASVFDLMVGHRILRRDLWPWGRAVIRLWLIASCIGYLAVTAVGGIEWLSRPAIAVLPVAQRARVEPVRGTFFHYAVYLAGSFPMLVTAYGCTAGRLRYRIVRVDVPITDLPLSLNGLRIVHLSDLHIGDFMPRAAIRKAVTMANTVQADLAVLTGDLISHDRDPLDDCIAELSQLRAPLGIWGCHGNHERAAAVEARAQALFKHYGMHLLRQQCAEVSWRGGAVNLIGVDDQRQRAGEPSPMLRGIESVVRRDIPNILLSHNPNTFERAAALGIELSLAGHTHGGQIRFALGARHWSPASLITPFVAGLYRLPLGHEARIAGAEVTPRRPKSAFLYVNRGLGTYGLPVRLGVPPEITVLTLRALG
jgi:predicted MPP superfamily phosphohydrolase